jgi:dipeptidyl aminopeptidase/acylaminoacyl peptidase
MRKIKFLTDMIADKLPVRILKSRSIGIVLLFFIFCQVPEINAIDKAKPAVRKDIHFTVRINLKFPEERSRALRIADSDSAYYDQVVLKLPENYFDTGAPVRLVYVAHGAGGGVTDTSWAWNRYSITDSLLVNGYACFDVNGGSSVENMGGSWVIQSAFKAYEYIRKHYNVYDKIFAFGGSMGGLSSTNFINKHSDIVLAHAMYSPVLDVYEQAWNNPWFITTRRAIAGAYNFADKSGKTWEPEKVIGWNPLFFNVFNNGTDTFKIYPVPVKIWHGINDPAAKINSSRKFQRYIQKAGGYCELRELDSGDHGLSCGNAFMNRELLLFFKRYDK